MWLWTFFATFLVQQISVHGKPTSEGGMAGPCADADDPMACMHGLLMHGDKEAGVSHEAEDNYLRFKSNLETGPQVKIGPVDAEEMFHGALMHGDEDLNVAHDHKDNGEFKPESPAKKLSLPQDANDYMHGVLMHGDDETGIDHKKEHQKSQEEAGESIGAQAPGDVDTIMHKLMHKDGDISHEHEKNEAVSSNAAAGAADLDNMMHKLMHADGDISHDHENANKNEISGNGAADLDNMMHKMMHADGDISHDHENANKNEISGNGAADLDNMMHKLMHADGDISHDHDKANANEESPSGKGAADVDDMMHKLMHKDGDISHDHDQVPSRFVTGNVGPRSEDLHGVLMHGDDEVGHVHEHSSSQRAFKMDKDAIRKLNIDADILRSVGMESILQDLDDYDEWKKNNAKRADMEMEIMSESILSDIEAMKRRYLQKAREIDLKQTSGITEEEALNNMADTEHIDADLAHNLELIGSTEPINDRHKVFKDEPSIYDDL